MHPSDFQRQVQRQACVQAPASGTHQDVYQGSALQAQPHCCHCLTSEITLVRLDTQRWICVRCNSELMAALYEVLETDQAELGKAQDAAAQQDL